MQGEERAWRMADREGLQNRMPCTLRRRDFGRTNIDAVRRERKSARKCAEFPHLGFVGFDHGMLSCRRLGTRSAGNATQLNLAEGKEMEDAVRFACKAASISVTRLGAQASAPFRTELE